MSRLLQSAAVDAAAVPDLTAAWFAGRLSDAEADALLAALTPDAATYEHFAALLTAVAATAVPTPDVDGDVLDCCGTGGGGRPHFNVSTTAAFVLAAGGVRVVKFGNRAATSAGGSFDLLERLGAPVEFPLERLPALLEATNLAFLYAPQCYPALKVAAAARRRFGRPTLFNYIGPLLHPLRPTHRLVGVSHPCMQAFAAQWLANDRRTRRALVVRGDGDKDELTPTGVSVVYDVGPQIVRKFSWAAESSGAPAAAFDDTPEANLALFRRIVAGEDADSPAYHGVRLNAGLGFVAAGRAADLAEGAALAAALLAGGRVRRKVELFLTYVQNA